MLLKCLIDPFGVNDASPDLPPHLIAVASLIPVRKELEKEIIDFYNLFFLTSILKANENCVII